MKPSEIKYVIDKDVVGGIPFYPIEILLLYTNVGWLDGGEQLLNAIWVVCLDKIFILQARAGEQYSVRNIIQDTKPEAKDKIECRVSNDFDVSCLFIGGGEYIINNYMVDEITHVRKLNNILPYQF